MGHEITVEAIKVELKQYEKELSKCCSKEEQEMIRTAFSIEIIEKIEAIVDYIINNETDLYK